MKHLLSAPSGGRTHTWRILSPLSLPLDYGGVQANLRVITRKSHIFAGKSEARQIHQLVNVLKVCQLKNGAGGIPNFESPPSLFQR